MNLSVILPLVRWNGLLFRLFARALLVAAACLSLLLLSLRYWLLPDIEQYRENIASIISSTSGQRVTIGTISANWDGLRPHMMLRTIKVHDKEGNPALLLDRLEGTLSWLSLLHGELRFRKIRIDQPDLIVRRDDAGEIHVAGFALSGGLTGGGENGFSDWLLRQPQVIINNANILWQDDKRNAPELELLVNLRLENHENRHRFGLRAVPPAGLASQMDIRGDLTGESLNSLERWNGRLFVQIDRADIAAWQAWLPFPGEIRFHRGTGALRIWAGIDDANMKKLTADMRLHNVKTQLAPNLPELNLTRLHGRAGWQRINDGTKEGIELFAHKLTPSVRGKRESQPINFSLRMNPAHGKSVSGKLSLDKLNLEVLGEFAAYLPLGEVLRKQLAETSPRGEIHYMRAKWDGEWPAPATFSAKAGFANLSMKKNENLPAFSGMTGNIDINDRGGTLNLNSQQVRLEMPDIFREAMALDTFTGQVSWGFPAGDSIGFKFNNVSFSNTHVSGTAYGSYRFVPGGAGLIDLTGHVKRADARYLARYMPVTVGSSFYDWLDKSIVAGEFRNARLHLKGDLSEFPFVRTDTGIFRLHAAASALTLDHLSGWPRIEDISGQLHVHGGHMKFDASQANISGTRLSNAKLHIADVTASDAMLESEGEINGPSGEFLKLAAKHTDGGYIRSVADDIRIDGNGKLLFKLDIPLHHPGDAKAVGNYQFIDNRIDPGSSLPTLDNVNGMLTFTGAGITIENVTAQILGGPAVVNSTVTPSGSTRISATGRIDLDNLHRPAQGSASGAGQLWRRHVRGGTDWQALIHIHGKSMDMSVQSSLKGITSGLPDPFSKNAADVTPLHLERRVSAFDEDILNLSYGGLVAAKIRRLRDNAGGYQAERGIVGFGVPLGSLPEKPGISVNGALPLLKLDQWRALLKHFDEKADSPLNLTHIALHVGALDVMGKRFNDITLNASKDEELWHSIVTSSEIKGGVSWEPAGNGKVVARLKKLVIPAASPVNPYAATQTPQQERDLPAIDVMADSFIIGGKQLGRLELIASPREQSWQVEKLQVINTDSSLTANGTWLSRATPPRMQAALTLEASDVGKFLAHLGYPGHVKRGSGKLEGVLSWHGGPRSVNFPSLSGSFKIKARRGQFPEFEPGIGRLFGMFDLRALPRRVTLDFHDVFSEGFGFDDISGDVKIIRGVVFTDDFRIEGPAARIVMKGELNLEAETQKLHVKVTPSLGLASPVVGIVSKALQNPAPYKEYNVTGTWEDPTIVKIPRVPKNLESMHNDVSDLANW